LPGNIALGILIMVVSLPSPVMAQESETKAEGIDPEPPPTSENASNPLAAVNNTDLRWQHIDLGSDRDLSDWSIDGAVMAKPTLKLRYELHYQQTNFSGRSHSEFDSLVLKAIWFPKQGVLDSGPKYRMALGLDWIHDLGDPDEGISIGGDQVGPFAGVALGFRSGLTIIPLLQHFFDVSGDDVSTTALRLIALQPFQENWWLKLDARIPYDWEKENVPADAEIQLGYNFNPYFALYADGLVGLGSDRLYDWGVGLGIRFNY